MAVRRMHPDQRHLWPRRVGNSNAGTVHVMETPNRVKTRPNPALARESQVASKMQ